MTIADPRNSREANYLALKATPEEIVERVLALVARQQQSVDLTVAVTGTLPVASGGTGVTSLTAHGVLVGEGTSNVAGITGSSNQVLHANTGSDPTFSAVSLTADITGVLAETHGGTNQSSYATGDTLYASAANTLSKLTGNTAATRKFMRQTGTGAVSAAPVWDTLIAADVPGAALTKVDDTNVTLTLGGSPSTAVLNAASITAGWTGQLGLTRGGTNASLTADNGAIVYSTAGAFALLASTATAGKMLRSGASGAPTWSSSTFPSSAGSAGHVPRSDGTNYVDASLAASDLSNGTTGSNAVVLATSPVLVTPTLGVAAATSINFGGTALSVYAENTFTPVLTCATPGDLAVTYTRQLGTYTKVGRKVTATFSIVTSAFTWTTASGTVQITGLPFTALTLTGHTWEGAVEVSGYTKAGFVVVCCRVSSNTSLCTLEAVASGSASAGLVIAELPSAGSVIIRGTITYET